MLLRIFNIDAICIGTLPATTGIMTLTGEVIKVNEETVEVSIDPMFYNGKTSKRVNKYDIKVPYAKLTDEQLATANIEPAAEIRLIEALRQLRDFNSAQAIEFIQYFGQNVALYMDKNAKAMGSLGCGSISTQSKMLAVMQLTKD